MEDFSEYLTPQFSEPNTGVQAHHNLKCATEALRRAVAERDLLLKVSTGAGVAQEIWALRQDVAARGYVDHTDTESQRRDAILHNAIKTLFKHLGLETDFVFDCVENEITDYAMHAEGGSYDD